MPLFRPSQDDLDRRKIVGVKEETVTNITSTDFPGHYPGEDHTWSLDRFKEGLKVQFYKNANLEASFSLIGVDSSLANAFRRILIAEVPTLAIEKVFVYNNTSLLADEVLSHRLGLIPLKGNFDAIDRMTWYRDEDEELGIAKTDTTDQNTVVLRLQVECTKNESAAKNETDSKKKYHNSHVYARHLEFTPEGGQEAQFGNQPVGPVNPEILIAKLRPGQVIDMLLHCVKGKGLDHAKFSPVATATYRLLPTIEILKPILDEDAKLFKDCFPAGVIELQRFTPSDARKWGEEYKDKEGALKAVVKDTFRDTVSRECLRHDQFKGKVKLGRVRDHFIFNVESTGQMDSDLLFLEAVTLLKVKAARLKRALTELSA